jgi:hypothetical protein
LSGYVKGVDGDGEESITVPRYLYSYLSFYLSIYLSIYLSTHLEPRAASHPAYSDLTHSPPKEEERPTKQTTMPSTLVLALAFLAACAALQLPLFALPLLYLRWRSWLNNFEAFVAVSLMFVSPLPNLHVPIPSLTISSYPPLPTTPCVNVNNKNKR